MDYLFRMSGDSNDSEQEINDSVAKSKLRKAYSTKFKLEAIGYARQTSKREAARKFRATSFMIRQWLKKETMLPKAVKTSMKLPGGGRHLLSRELKNQTL